MKSHLEAQKLLSDSARVAHGLLDKVTAKAANLETILNDAATHFNELPLLGISISPWAVCALLLCLMAMQNPKLTAILVLSGGKLTRVPQIENAVSTLTDSRTVSRCEAHIYGHAHVISGYLGMIIRVATYLKRSGRQDMPFLFNYSEILGSLHLKS